MTIELIPVPQEPHCDTTNLPTLPYSVPRHHNYHSCADNR